MRSSFWTVLLVIIVAAVLCFAGFETYQTLLGRLCPDYASGVGELLLVIVLGIGEIFAFGHLKLELRNDDFNTWKKAQEVWTEEKFTKSRGMIFQRLKGSSQPWTSEQKQEALGVCRKLDEFAHLVPFLGIKKVLKYWDDPLAKSWIVLESIVEEERKTIGFATKWKAFEDVGKAALAKLVKEGRTPVSRPDR